MINNSFNSIRNANSLIGDLLKEQIQVPCTFTHGKSEIKGLIIGVGESKNNPSISIQSHTGVKRWILISSLMTIKGIEEL